MVPEQNDPVQQGYKSITSHHQYKNAKDSSTNQTEQQVEQKKKEKQTSHPPS